MPEVNNEQIIIEQRRAFDLETPDNDLILAIDQAIAESRVLKDEKDKEGIRNEEYWKYGCEKKVLDSLPPKKAKTVNNRIWTNLLTILPYWVNQTPEITPVYPGLKNQVREKLIESATTAWEIDDNMKWKMQQTILHWVLYKIGILKIRWNPEKKGIETFNVLPLKIGFDPRATTLKNCEYIWEILEDTAENLAKKFPEKEKEIYALVGGEENKKTKLQYIEFWGDNGKMVVWKLQNIILDKKRNPNFDYENPENNLFKEPQFPYLVLNCFNLGYSLYDDSSIVEQAIPLQDSVNKLERQILDLNEGQKRVWIASAEAVSREDFQKIIDETGDIGVFMSGKIPQGGLQVPLAGRPDAAIFSAIQHLLTEIDNVMGVHAATRGQYEPGMGRIGMRGFAMMIQQDLSKDLIVSRIEQLSEDWFNMFFHLSKVYAVDSVTFNTSSRVITLFKEDIPVGLRIMVKKGSMLPIDRATRADMAIKLTSMGLEAPIDLYEDLGYGDAIDRVENLQEMKQGNLLGKKSPDHQNLDRLRNVLESAKFQQLSDGDKQMFLQRAREIVEAVSQQGGIPQGGLMQ